MGAACVTHPLDLAKVRMQTAKVRVGLLKTIGNVYKYEGNALPNCTTLTSKKAFFGYIVVYRLRSFDKPHTPPCVSASTKTSNVEQPMRQLQARNLLLGHFLELR